jgi:hypothetical protein
MEQPLRFISKICTESYIAGHHFQIMPEVWKHLLLKINKCRGALCMRAHCMLA